MGMHPPLHGVDVGDRREVEIFAPDEGRELAQELLAGFDVAGNDTRLDQGGALPVLAEALVIGKACVGRERDLRCARVGAKAQIGAEHIAVAGMLLEETHEFARQSHEEVRRLDIRPRAQLFQRHRLHRLLRRGPGRARAGYRAVGLLRATDARARSSSAGAYRRRLCVPHRFAPGPDPGATQIALPTDAGLTYYESFGQNWERAALIKARVIAGDIEAGEEFLRHSHPSSGVNISTSRRSPTSTR